MEFEEQKALEQLIIPIIENHCCRSCDGYSRDCGGLQADECAGAILELLEKEGRLKNDNGN